MHTNTKTKPRLYTLVTSLVSIVCISFMSAAQSSAPGTPTGSEAEERAKHCPFSHPSAAPEVLVAPTSGASTPKGIALNDHFHDVMRESKEHVLSGMGPVIVCGPDLNYLYKCGELITACDTSSRMYHTAKNISHVPATLASHLHYRARSCPHSRGESSGSSEPSDEELAQSISSDLSSKLRTYMESLESYRTHIAEDKFEAVFYEVHYAILDRSITFLSKILTNNELRREDYDSYFSEIREFVSLSNEMSALNKVTSIHSVFSKWRHKHPGFNWGDMRVIVKGVDQARNNNITSLYFRTLMPRLGIETQAHGSDDPARILFFTVEKSGRDTSEIPENMRALHELAGRLVHRIPSTCVLADPRALEAGDILFSAKLMQALHKLVENEVALRSE